MEGTIPTSLLLLLENIFTLLYIVYVLLCKHFLIFFFHIRRRISSAQNIAEVQEILRGDPKLPTNVSLDTVSKYYASWCVACPNLSTTQLESSNWRKRTTTDWGQRIVATLVACMAEAPR